MTNHNSKNIPGILFALIAGASWGFSGTAGQYLFMNHDIDSGWLTTFRMITSGTLLIIITLMSDRIRLKRLFKNRKDTVSLVLFGIFVLMVVQYSYLKTIAYSNSGTATAIQYSGEAMVLIYTCLVFKRLPKLPELSGLFLALGGIFILSTHGDIHTLVISKEGLIWGLISAVTLMLYTVVPGRLVTEYGSMVISGCGMLTGGIVLALITGFDPFRYSFSPGLALGLASIIIIGTVMAYSLFLTSVTYIGPLKAGLLSSIETVSAPFFSKVWLKTDFTGMDYTGFAMILVMVAFLSLPELMEEQKHTKALKNTDAQ